MPKIKQQKEIPSMWNIVISLAATVGTIVVKEVAQEFVDEIKKNLF